MKKNATPPIQPHYGNLVKPLNEQPPFLPRGTLIECWGGSVAIDHSLQVWDCGQVNNGSGWRPYAACVSGVADLPPRDRRVLADYMIALWSAFRDHPEVPNR